MFFDANTNLYLDTTACKTHAAEVLASLNFLFLDPEAGTGLFCSELVITTLSSYYCQIQGMVDVPDIRHSMSYCDEGPVGAIAPSLASVSCFTVSELI